MIHGKKVTVVLPAYNAATTLEKTFQEIPFDVVDAVLMVDDASTDNTVVVARQLGITTFQHDRNLGYGGNQKTCYREALKLDSDVVIMLHPDYQYTPKLIGAMASLIAIDQYDLVLGSRIISGGALRGGMPLYKYVANRFLTLFENLMLGQKISEYHTGYRAYSKRLLQSLPLQNNSDDFVFDNEFIAQAVYFGYRVGEISCPTKYFPEASSINFRRSVKYGLGVLRTALAYRLAKWNLIRHRIFTTSSPGKVTN
ncbi:MAG TPA: glycosyltransferase family 2 protein [bacterium]|nr:glycosyltransferase family 2 protein [bacterium]HPG45840.1 glycosyltransferase family 2 protein [bacterium]HPM97933.1 glycosyltransferase family 2 protein [bacterium]